MHPFPWESWPNIFMYALLLFITILKTWILFIRRWGWLLYLKWSVPKKRPLKGNPGMRLFERWQTRIILLATTHYELYMVIMKLPHSQNHVLEIAAGRILEPIFHVFADFALDDTQKIHWQRILRSMMHGFISHEQCGAFSRFPICRSTTYQMAIQCILDGLHRRRKGTR